MIDILLCHSLPDRDLASHIAERLEQLAEARVSLQTCDPAAGETVAEKWGAGLSSATILLLLSPDAVPAERTRAAWQSILQYVERNELPPLGSILLRDCLYARLLERRRFYRWSDGETAVLRAVSSWLLTLHPASGTRLFRPAPLPWFQGRAEELEMLWKRLVDGSGTVVLSGEPGGGKTSLAQEFAHTSAGHFRDVLWIDCEDRSAAFVAGDLESQLGIAPSVPLHDGFEQVLERAAVHRLLLVLDDAPGDVHAAASLKGYALVLITTQSTDASGFIRVTGPAAPAEPPADPASERLWRAMAVCRRNGLPLEFATAIAGLALPTAQVACERLVAASLADPLDESRTRFRLSARSRHAARACTGCEDLQRAHATALSAALATASPPPWFVQELENGLSWAHANDWDLARGLSHSSFRHLKGVGRLREAARVYVLLRDHARDRGETDLAAECAWELSWIREEPGEILRRPTPGQQLALDLR